MVLNRWTIPLALSFSLAFAGLACGGAQTPKQTPVEPAKPAPPPEPSALPKGHAWRYQVMQVMSPGLGAFLQRVDVKEKMVDGRFHGFQILALQGDPSFWEGVDLKVGDVVTSVNGGPIGHYEEAFRVWQSLLTAPEIVVAYERGPEKRTLRIVVHEDDESAPVTTTADEPAPKSTPKPSAKPVKKNEPPSLPSSGGKPSQPEKAAEPK